MFPAPDTSEVLQADPYIDPDSMSGVYPADIPGTQPIPVAPAESHDHSGSFASEESSHFRFSHDLSSFSSLGESFGSAAMPPLSFRKPTMVPEVIGHPRVTQHGFLEPLASAKPQPFAHELPPLEQSTMAEPSQSQMPENEPRAPVQDRLHFLATAPLPERFPNEVIHVILYWLARAEEQAQSDYIVHFANNEPFSTPLVSNRNAHSRINPRRKVPTSPKASPSNRQLFSPKAWSQLRLLDLSRTCKSWRHAALRKEFWQTLNAPGFDGLLTPKALLSIASTCGPFIHELNLNGMSDLTDHTFCRIILRLVAQDGKSTSLRKISLAHCNNISSSSLIMLFSLSPNLESVGLMGLAPGSLSKHVFLTIGNLNRLERLDIRHSKDVDIHTLRMMQLAKIRNGSLLWPRLQILQARGCTRLFTGASSITSERRRNTQYNPLRYFPLLRVLDVADVLPDTFQMSWLTLPYRKWERDLISRQLAKEELPNTMPRITFDDRDFSPIFPWTHLIAASSATPDRFFYLLGRIPELRVLDIRGSDFLDDLYVLPRIFFEAVHLTHLDVSKTSLFSSNIRALCTHFVDKKMYYRMTKHLPSDEAIAKPILDSRTHASHLNDYFTPHVRLAPVSLSRSFPCAFEPVNLAPAQRYAMERDEAVRIRDRVAPSSIFARPVAAEIIQEKMRAHDAQKNPSSPAYSGTHVPRCVLDLPSWFSSPKPLPSRLHCEPTPLSSRRTSRHHKEQSPKEHPPSVYSSPQQEFLPISSMSDLELLHLAFNPSIPQQFDSDTDDDANSSNEEEETGDIISDREASQISDIDQDESDEDMDDLDDSIIQQDDELAFVSSDRFSNRSPHPLNLSTIFQCTPESSRFRPVVAESLRQFFHKLQTNPPQQTGGMRLEAIRFSEASNIADFSIALVIHSCPNLRVLYADSIGISKNTAACFVRLAYARSAMRAHCIAQAADVHRRALPADYGGPVLSTESVLEPPRLNMLESELLSSFSNTMSQLSPLIRTRAAIPSSHGPDFHFSHHSLAPLLFDNVSGLLTPALHESDPNRVAIHCDMAIKLVDAVFQSRRAPLWASSDPFTPINTLASGPTNTEKRLATAAYDFAQALASNDIPRLHQASQNILNLSGELKPTTDRMPFIQAASSRFRPPDLDLARIYDGQN